MFISYCLNCVKAEGSVVPCKWEIVRSTIPREEPYGHSDMLELQKGETGRWLVGIDSFEMKKTVGTSCECFYILFEWEWKFQLYDMQINNSFQPYLIGKKPKGAKQSNIIYKSTDNFMALCDTITIKM